MIKKSKAKKLFGSFKYIIENNTFYVFREYSKLDLFITFTQKGKTFHIHVVRNISDERNLSFKVYRAILDLTEFDEITTGDALTLNNISAHKKALSTFKLYIRTKEGDSQLHNDIDYYMKRDNPNELFVLKESGQLRYIRENFNNDLEETLDEYIDYYFKENEKLNEVQRTGHQERAEFSAENEFLRLQRSSLLKELKSRDSYSLYKYHDYLFLSKDDRYIAHLDGTTDKLEGKKSFYITVMYSEQRGAMDILFFLMKDGGYKYIVSDTMLSDDAIKYYEKLMKRHKYFGIDYLDEKIKATDEELLSNPDYRIVIIL